MVEFYLDTVDLEQISRFNHCLPLKGITTNPTILAKAGIGINRLLPEITSLLGVNTRVHIQVVSDSVDGMVFEAQKLHALPYDIVVKVPATEIGLAAIRQIKGYAIPVLATAIYSAEQGFLAAMCGADYLAPYVNRMDVLGIDGVAVVSDLQNLVACNQLNSVLLPASFKNSQQVLRVLKLGVGAITLPVNVVEALFSPSIVQPAVERFDQDWQSAFGGQKSYES
ncbi:MAG TPA: fructose-6-phosphate aldolase [Methylococcaceae bacterium]|jgi:fructose-6-phosphate aldolase 1|nr:fructose-6-phosphate aldolase [Methylococcaceae bacterium]HIN69589.1 fructose-6-phosphate aldolase [Methylococcales bacterium]HIA45028.1 fructose-6-phosphate aldolase [Methylococcaceae bacterium]HIB61667.1 fructose-6-phosphate aldolase [Methylococcaceae bacterium]HIO12193.1 fructose-6-phosphate aldolase [Methylococcales bacterium]